MTMSAYPFALNVQEFRNLISEIESNTSGTVANIIRKLRQMEAKNNVDSSEILTVFMNYLEQEMQMKSDDIKNFCNFNYQGFVESIRELLKVQEDASDLKRNFGEVKQSLSTSFGKLNKDCAELSKCYSILNNIDKAIENLQMFLPVFDQYLKAEKCIKEKRYYPALKALNHLELNQIQRVRHFALAETLQNEIPGMREKIKSASKDEIKDFLETVRKHSTRLGSCTMKQSAEKSGMAIIVEGTTKKLLDSTSIKKGKESERNAKLINYSDEPDVINEELKNLVSTDSFQNDDDDLSNFDSGFTNVEDLVDFGPVYRCLHIHTVLGDRHEFEKCYRTQRKRQCTLLLTLTKQESIRNYFEFFSGIAGFFVVEDYIRHSQMSIVTRNYLDELWSHTIARINDFVQDNSDKISDIETLLELKNNCVLFGKTMRSMGFNVAGFKDLYDVLRRKYQKLLNDDYLKKFQEIFEGEDYTAITVNSPSEMELVVDFYPNFLSPDIHLLPYPKSLSFSWMVPRIYQSVREHIKKSKQFADNLELSQTELEDQLNHTTNILFSTLLCPHLEKSIKDSSGQLNRLIQLAVNMDELESACHNLQLFILSLVGAVFQNTDILSTDSHVDLSRSRLHAFTIVKDIRSKIEDSIYNSIYRKIDFIFDENTYSLINSPKGGSRNNSPSHAVLQNEITPSEFITDVISYLRTTFESFTNLPVRLAQTACLLSCKYINDKVHKFMEHQPRISKQFLQQLSVDIKCLEEFSRNIPVSGISPDTLILVFEEMRQLTDLFLSSDWNTYIQNYGKSNNPYDRVSKLRAISIFEKTIENEPKLLSLIRIKKTKDKTDEENLRRLRELR